MLIAEDLALLLVDGRSGALLLRGSRLDGALAGAVLAELVLLGRVVVVRRGLLGRSAAVVVRDALPVGEPVLDEALRRLLGSASPTRMSEALRRCGAGLGDGVLHRLAVQGLLRAEQGRVLRVFATERWVHLDPSPRQALLATVHEALVLGRFLPPREVALVRVLGATGQVHRVLPDVGVPASELRRRARAADDGYGLGAIGDSVDAICDGTSSSTSSGWDGGGGDGGDGGGGGD